MEQLVLRAQSLQNMHLWIYITAPQSGPVDQILQHRGMPATQLLIFISCQRKQIDHCESTLQCKTSAVSEDEWEIWFENSQYN